MIFYFSGTGNSRYCAEFIASKLNGEKLISLNKMMKNNVNFIDCKDETRLGIAAPTYDMDLAYAMAEFLEKLEFRNITERIYVYGIITCGSMSGNSIETLKKILAKKKITLNASFIVIMPDNYVLMFPQKSDEVKKATLEKADETLKEIVKNISEEKNIFNNKGKFPKIALFFIHKFFIPSQKKVKGFSVNEKCVGCGKCEKICPMNVIEIRNNKPVWTKDNCACCLACLHHCPTQAINRGKSAKNGRYLNPKVNF